MFLQIFTALVFVLSKTNNGTAGMNKYKSDSKLYDYNWRDFNEYLLSVKCKSLNYELSKLINYQKIYLDFQFLYLTLENGLYNLRGYACIFLALSPMLYFVLLKYNNSNYKTLFLDTFQTLLKHNCDHITTTSNCTSSHTYSYKLPTAPERSINGKSTKQEMKSKFNEVNQSQTETSGLLGSPKAVVPDGAAAYLPTNLEPSKSSLDKTNGLNTKSKAANTTTYATDKLPGATGSHSQHYETDFGNNIPISKEESRKNVRPVRKEKDVDSFLQSYKKDKVTPGPTAMVNILPHFEQDKTQPPAKTLPSSSVNKSHRSLPRKACVVYLKEQYHLDHNLLSQPRATKYLIKVRTEISPGRYMAKLELHCSR